MNEYVVIVAHKKQVVYHNKPYYMGFSIFGMSKMAKYQFTVKNYLFSLKNQRAQRIDDLRIPSKCQQIPFNIIQKITTSGLMEKRYAFDCGIHTLLFWLNNSSRCYETECN